MAGLGPSPALFFDTINAYQKTAALRAAIEVELFTAIGAGRITPAAIAEHCRVAERGARILADYLTVLGFLTKQEGRYALTGDSALFLDKKSPAYVGGAVEFLQAPQMLAHFADLTTRVRAGGALADGDDALAPEAEMWVRFARGMAPLAATIADLLAQRVLAGSKAPLKVLDIAAGHGLYGIAFAKQNPQARVVGQDWANVLAVAQENAGKAGVSDRYTRLPGSAFEVDFGSGLDVVLLTNFLHHFDPATNVKLLKKVHAALVPGGRAVALEFVPNADRITPPLSATFSIAMLANTPAGDAYTFKELEGMYREAGFKSAEFVDLQPTMEQVVIGHK